MSYVLPASLSWHMKVRFWPQCPSKLPRHSGDLRTFQRRTMQPAVLTSTQASEHILSIALLQPVHLLMLSLRPGHSRRAAPSMAAYGDEMSDAEMAQLIAALEESERTAREEAEARKAMHVSPAGKSL